MNTAARAVGLVGLWAAVTLAARSACAEGDPLLVVVEAPPALGADAAEIRRAIGAELHIAVAAPTQANSDRSDRALIVALDGERIAMSLRSNEAPPMVRIIAAPADRAAWLRTIAWLAGNLARDQVSPIIAQSPPLPPTLTTASASPATPPATEPPPASTAPPPTSAPAPPPALPDLPVEPTVAVRTATPTPRSPLRWSVTGSIGPLILGIEHQPSSDWWAAAGLQPGTMWQLAVQRRRERDRLVIGGALEGTYTHNGNGPGPQLIGAEVFVGADWRYRYCTLEATIGAGPEATNTFAYDTYPSIGGGVAISPYATYYLDLFARGAVAATFPLGGALEGMLQLGIHLNASRDEQWFAASTLGLRYTLP